MGNISVHVTQETADGVMLHLESMSSAERICRVVVRTSGDRTVLCVRSTIFWPFRQKKDVWIPGGIPGPLYVAENNGRPYPVKLLPWLKQ